MRETQPETLKRRVYPLDAHDLTEEQVAVAFAMTSRRPQPLRQDSLSVGRPREHRRDRVVLALPG